MQLAVPPTQPEVGVPSGLDDEDSFDEHQDFFGG